MPGIRMIIISVAVVYTMVLAQYLPSTVEILQNLPGANPIPFMETNFPWLDQTFKLKASGSTGWTAGGISTSTSYNNEWSKQSAPPKGPNQLQIIPGVPGAYQGMAVAAGDLKYENRDSPATMMPIPPYQQQQQPMQPGSPTNSFPSTSETAPSGDFKGRPENPQYFPSSPTPAIYSKEQPGNPQYFPSSPSQKSTPQDPSRSQRTARIKKM